MGSTNNVKLKARVKNLEKINMVKSSKLRRLKKVETSQRVESSDDMENVFNQGRIIFDMDQDNGIELVADQEKDAEVEGRHADKQHPFPDQLPAQSRHPDPYQQLSSPEQLYHSLNLQPYEQEQSMYQVPAETKEMELLHLVVKVNRVVGEEVKMVLEGEMKCHKVEVME
nr:hypothetical protein [Tanacetum cinerariifolium]